MTWLAIYLLVLIGVGLTIVIHLSDIKDEMREMRKIMEKEDEK